MKTLNPKAILIGCLVDWLGTLAFDLFFVVTTGMMAGVRGLNLEETGAALTEWYQSVPGMGFSFLCGLGFTLLGGFVAAKIANAGNLLNSALVGAVGILLGLILTFEVFPNSEIPKAISYLSMLVSIPVSILGGFCHTKKWKLF
jgi:hypothetical protein